MPVGGEVSDESNPRATPRPRSGPTPVAKAMRVLRTALLYLLVSVGSFVAVVVLFSIAETLWRNR